MNVKTSVSIDIEYLNEALKDKDWTYYRLAKESGISLKGIYRIKKGECSRNHAHLIAKTLGIEESRLLGEEPAKVSAFQAYATIATIAHLLGVSPQTAFRNIEKEYEAKKRKESTNDRD